MLNQSFAHYAKQHRGVRGPVKAGLAATLAATFCIGGQVALMISYSQSDAAADTIAVLPLLQHAAVHAGV